MRHLILILSAMALGACSRSPAYQHDRVKAGRGQSESERNRLFESTQKFAPLRKRAVVLPLWNDTPVKGKFEVLAKNQLRDSLLDTNKLNLVKAAVNALTQLRTKDEIARLRGVQL